MASSCEFRTSEASTKAWLRTRNIIDKYLNILDLPKFRTTVTDLSNTARTKYGVEGRLFTETNNGTKAVPNKAAFKAIDSAKGIYYQTEGLKQSIADEPTLAKVKEVIDKMGISLVTLSEYTKTSDIDTTDVNGLADLVKNVIAIAEGKEHEALTEEMVHITTAALEQIEPRLVTELISKIDRFKIYKLVLEKYRNDPRYQLENGKPNIRKIKKEAVDKLIAEIIINDGVDTEQFPELMEEENVGLFQRLWRAILDFLSNRYRDTNISIYSNAATRIMEGVDVSPLRGEGIYLQKTIQSVDQIYDALKTEHSKLKIVPATDKDDRHYVYDGQRVRTSVTKKVKGDRLWDTTEFQQMIYDQQRDWGSEAHDYIHKYATAALIDENGYARPEPLATDITTRLPEFMKEAIRQNLKEWVNSYKPGTRFLLESRLANTKVKGLLASTLDFIAIEPNDETGFKMDILDWKFSDINKDITEDIPWYKQGEWKAQMNEYVKMMYNLNVKPNQIRKARMIPFVVKYNPEVKGDWYTPLKITGIEVGKIDSLKETSLYLLPVPVDVESTGFKKVDELVDSLQKQYDKLFKTFEGLSQKAKKKVKLDELAKSIRRLQMNLNFDPLVGVMKTFLNDAAKLYRDLETIDYSTLSREDVESRLRRIIEFKNTASKFVGIDGVFLSIFEEGVKSPEDKKTLANLEREAARVSRMLDKFTQLQKDYVVHLALKSGLSLDEITSPEAPITSFLDRSFLEGTDLSSTVIKLGTKLIMKSKSLAKVRAKELTDQYFEKLRAFEKEAAAIGKNPFDMIAKVDGGNLSFVKKLDKKFYQDLDKAKKDKDKEFFLENVDYEKYKKAADAIIKQSTEELETVIFDSDPEINKSKLEYEINRLKNTYDLNSPKFIGFNSSTFEYLFRNNLKEDVYLSDDYKELKKHPAAFAVWEFFTETLNRRAIQMGYLKDKGVSFFPLVEAAFLQKVSQTGDVIGQAREFFNDLYTVNSNEEQTFAKYDPETKSVRKEIPRLFTRTEKAMDQLSKDLTKVGALWIESLMMYEENKLIENTLLTLHAFEKTKGQLVVNPLNGELVMKGGDYLVDTDKSVNADLFETIIDHSIYGIREDEKSLGNVSLSAITDKLVKEDEKRNAKKVSIKKGFDNMNVLTQSLAVGLKALVAIPNYFGVNFQAFINSGNFYDFRSEYLKNEAKFIADTVGMPTLSTIEKALIDLFVPLNDSVSGEAQRNRAIKDGKYMQWVSSWSFNDVMMSTNSFPERKLQLTNALSMLQNTMLVDGKLVNIRQYVYQQDLNRYGMSYEERRKIESTVEERIKKLKQEKSLVNIAKIEDGKLVIEGLTQEQIAEYRNVIIEYGRTLSGQMNMDNAAGYRRDTILKSLMMFKGWIPKQVGIRTLDIRKDVVTGEWRYGRSRLFFKIMLDLARTNIKLISDINQGTDAGLEYMDSLLEAKKEDYKRKTGKELTITKEEFYDLVRRELANQYKELGLFAGLAAMVFAAKAAKPDDDDDEYAKNRYKFWAKAMNKIYDEISFYYNPASIESITSGNIIPQVILLSKVAKAFGAVYNETVGEISGDQELVDKTHVIKYLLDPIPIASQAQRELLPLVYPDLAKELGIRTTEQARMMR